MTFFKVCCTVIVITIIAWIITKIVVLIKPKNKKSIDNTQIWIQEETIGPSPVILQYKRKYLLTKNEWSFYKKLKPIADKLGYCVLAKIRMADLVEPQGGSNSKYYQEFARIKAKHIDFALCNPENLAIVLLIELDDNSHQPGNARDTFIEMVYAQTGYKLLRVRNNDNLELENEIRRIMCHAH